jgi:signal transduction histidine kinase/ActR/RegA family two-component response regulator
VGRWTFESFLDHVVPGDRRSVETSFLETESTGTGLDLECRITRADGAERWIWTKARIKHDSLGRPERMLGIVGDHTGRKQIVEAERTGRERLRMALTAARMVAWQFDPSTGAVVMSDNITDVFGLPVGTSDIAQALAILHPDDVDQHHTLIDQAARRNEGFVSEFRIFRPDTGAMQWMEERGHSVRETPGGPTRLVGVVMDITGRKRAEDELRRLAAELSEADRRKDEFLATLAHELRNPLAPIRNGLELMKLVGGEAPIVAEARTMMDRQLTQMVRLVDDLMDVSRISGGKIELRKERVSLATVVHSAVETSRPQIEKMGHKLTINLPAQPIFMDADLTRLAQVFLNLLNNAAKYSDRGGDIRLTAHQQGRDVVVSVVDNGIGIAVDQLQRIFDMFIQVDRSLEKSHGGLGIGLTLVKRLVELHGGFVEAKSDGPGMGSEFVVRLPVVADASLSQSLHPGDSSGAKTSLRILIVDDNRDGADSLSAMLRLMGNDTLTAYDGRQGIEAARKFRPDVILLDIGLPLVNGYEVCRRIREQPWCQDTVFIAVTGWGQEQDRRRSQEAGFDRHMIKPVDPAALMKLLSTHQSMKT